MPQQPRDLKILINLASPRLGATVLSASDEFFTEKEIVLDDAPPTRDDTKFTERGRWVDAWMTRRRREPGFEWLTLHLAQPGVVEACELDFRHLDGNQPEFISIDACALPILTPMNRFTVDRFLWSQILPPSPVEPGMVNRFRILNPYRYTHLRFNLHPDGGIARLRVFGSIVRENLDGEIDLAALDNGALCVQASDETFGAANSMLMPGRPEPVADAWHTRRLRGDPGFEWADIRLAAEGSIRRIEVDTSFFRGDAPERCSIENLDNGYSLLDAAKLHANLLHRLQPARTATPAELVRFRIYPDGGVARLRLFGHLTEYGRLAHRLQLRNTLPPPDAVAWFLKCFDSEEWARQLTSSRPFVSYDHLMDTGERIAAELGLAIDSSALRAKLQL